MGATSLIVVASNSQVSTLYLLLRVTLSIVKHTPSKEVLGEAFGLKMEDMLWRYVVKESSMCVPPFATL